MAQTKISLLLIVLAAVTIAPIQVFALPLPGNQGSGPKNHGTGSSHPPAHPQAPGPAQGSGHPTGNPHETAHQVHVATTSSSNPQAPVQGHPTVASSSSSPKKKATRSYKPVNPNPIPPGSDSTAHYDTFVGTGHTIFEGLKPGDVQAMTSPSTHTFQLEHHEVIPPAGSSSGPSGSQHQNVPPQVNTATGSMQTAESKGKGRATEVTRGPSAHYGSSGPSGSQQVQIKLETTPSPTFPLRKAFWTPESSSYSGSGDEWEK